MSHRHGLPRLTLNRAVRLLNKGLLSCEDVCLYCHRLAVAGEEHWQLNAFTRIMDLDSILEQARASDQRRQENKAGLLDGIPVSVKANLAVSNVPLTAASRVLGNQDDTHTPPCGYDADVVNILLRQCGAVLIGVTNMDEFGMGSLGTNVCTSPLTGATVTRNPLPLLGRLGVTGQLSKSKDDDVSLADFIRSASKDESIIDAHVNAIEEAKDEPRWSAGGSSCGSAASVAHGSSLVSLGSDTGGSIRLPASWCGVAGFKPSYGVFSRHGLVSYASSLDTVGILAPSVGCAESVFHVLSNKASVGASRDSTASFVTNEPPPTGTNSQDDGNTDLNTAIDLSEIRIGIPAAFSVTDCPESIRNAWALAAEYLQHHGATICTIEPDVISPEIVQHSLAAYYVLASAEASSNLKRYDGVRYGTAAESIQVDEEEDDELSGMTLLERQYSATRTSGFGREVARRILCGTSVLSSDRFHSHYEAAARLRAVLTLQLQTALSKVDLILIPTSLSFPYQFDGEPPDSTEMFGNDVMTVPISLAGLPSASVPWVVDSPQDEHNELSGAGCIAGLQLVGKQLDETTVLDVAKVLDQANKI